MRTLLIIAAVATFTTAAAEDKGPRTEEEVKQVFQSLDRDDDELVSKREAARDPSLRERFGGVDESRDGYLSMAEYRARPSDEEFE